jgi:predicted DNA-binding transcriptional regulator YafY
MRAIRLFSLLDSLRSRRDPVSGEALAQEHGVSLRTIYRDMASLQAMGAPVRGEAGVGYQLERGFFLPPLNFDPDELDSVALGVRMAAASGDAALSRAARRASAKIAEVLCDERRGDYESAPFHVMNDVENEETAAGRHLGALRVAIRARSKLRVTVAGPADTAAEPGGPRTVVVRPLGLTCCRTVWFLSAWSDEEERFIVLRVDRIETVQVTGERFRPERGRRFEDFLTLRDELDHELERYG